MADDTYVLDLWVTGASIVSVKDDGTGNDTIRVKGVYSKTIAIDLAWTIADGTPLNAGSNYHSADDINHQLVIFGVIENAFGSNGCDVIAGNDLGNLLSGDQDQFGAGMSDTISGGDGDDRIYGGAGDDDLQGQAGDDAMWGDAGNDRIDAGSGIDTVEGGSGADRLDGGGDAGDTLSYATSLRGVIVQLQAGTATIGRGGDAEGDQISGFFNVIGSALKDRIDFADKTTLPFGQSDNAVYGGAGGDKITVGGGDDQVFGGKGNDVIYGELGNDTLSGDIGSDKLSGGYGQDFLTGGTGADRFIFAAPASSLPDSPDVIADFSTFDHDRIDLKAIDADITHGGNQAFQWITSDFTGAPGALRAEAQGSDLVISADINGDGQADFSILLRDILVVTQADFIL